MNLSNIIIQNSTQSQPRTFSSSLQSIMNNFLFSPLSQDSAKAIAYQINVLIQETLGVTSNVVVKIKDYSSIEIESVDVMGQLYNFSDFIEIIEHKNYHILLRLGTAKKIVLENFREDFKGVIAGKNTGIL